MKTPKILEPALRQYQHNDCSGFVHGFEYKETCKIINIMEKALIAQSRLLFAYRIGGRAPEWALDAIESARAIGIKIL